MCGYIEELSGISRKILINNCYVGKPHQLLVTTKTFIYYANIVMSANQTVLRKHQACADVTKRLI